MANTLKRGDRVLVIAGNDKGRSGEILSRTKERVLVQGINIRKKHLRRTQQTQGGRIVEMEVPIHISNVVLCDSEGVRVKKAPKSQAKAPEKKSSSSEKKPKKRAATKKVKKDV